MAALTREQIRKVLGDAGFKGQDLNTAVAIALAESGGDPSKYNGKDKDSSYGLMQINLKGKLGPDRRAKYHINANNDLFNPAENARVAYAIYKDAGGGFRDWTTYTRGTYVDFLDNKNNEVGDKSLVDSAKDALDSAGIPNPIAGVAAAINAVGINVTKVFANIGGILLALVLLVLGVVILLRSQIPVAKVAKAVLK